MGSETEGMRLLLFYAKRVVGEEGMKRAEQFIEQVESSLTREDILFQDFVSCLLTADLVDVYAQDVLKQLRVAFDSMAILRVLRKGDDA